MPKVEARDLGRVVSKLEEFMQYCQRLKKGDTYLIVNRHSPILAEAARKAAENLQLEIKTLDLAANRPYEHFPRKLIKLLCKETPKAGMGLFDYSKNPDWALKEAGARIELLREIIEEVPISWAHSPHITLDMAVNGPLQCNYRKMAEEAEQMLRKLQNTKRIHITAPRGTDIEIQVPKQVKFETDCIIVPPNVYGKPGKIGNLPVGEVWSDKGKTIQVLNKETGKEESHHYPVKQIANGKLVCDIDPEKLIIVQFENGVLTDIQCEDPALNCIRDDMFKSQKKYGLPTVLEELGIGLNEKARATGNMLEDEKIRGTCHLAPGNIRFHVDMLVNKPTITVAYMDGTTKEIMRNGTLT